MPTVRWRLADFLQEHDLTAYRLAKESGITRVNTLYRLVRKGSEPTRVDLATLALVIHTLRRLVGPQVQLTDILEYVEDGDMTASELPQHSLDVLDDDDTPLF